LGYAISKLINMQVLRDEVLNFGFEKIFIYLSYWNRHR